MQKVRNCFKGKLALLLVCALVVGMLPAGASEANTARSGYGLNNPSTDSNGIMTWDCVWFGNYPQSDATGMTKDPIKWRVLSVNGDDAFLLADTNLDVQRYNDTNTSVTWETCTMRSWLNSTFLNKAFNATEQAAIKDTTVVNEDNPEYGTEGGNNTTDKVYLLSISEVLKPGYGFVSDYGAYAESRRAKNTAYAKEQGAWTSTSEDYAGNGDWWLRSPGFISSYASHVYVNGYAYQNGRLVHNIINAVRPALHLNLSSTSVWSYAGQVTADGGEKPKPTPVPAAPYPALYDFKVNYMGENTQEAKKKKGIVPVKFDEAELKNNSKEYNHNIARFCSVLSTLAYDIQDGYEDMLKKMGYDYDSMVLDKNGDSICYGLANKRIYLDGKETDVVLVVLRGTYNMEWVDNFDPGMGKTHKGFQKGADTAYQALKKYVAEKKIGKDGRKTKIIVTGHSRGAAVANLLGKDIIDKGGSFLADSGDLFDYSFATPNSTSSVERKNAKYNGIFSIVNPEDFVTKVMISKNWDYGRYGRTLILPSSSTDNRRSYASYLGGMQDKFHGYRPYDNYKPYPDGMNAVSNYVNLVAWTVPNVSSYYTQPLGVGYSVSGTSLYGLGNTLRKLYTCFLGYNQCKNPAYEKASYLTVLNAVKGDYGFLGQSTVAYFIVNQVLDPRFKWAHLSETYLAAMNTLSAEDLYKNGKPVKRGIKHGIVNCPVDVSISSGTGEVVAAIENNQIVKETEGAGVNLSVAGDSKQFWISGDEDYIVSLTGNDTGTMDYILAEEDADNGETQRVLYKTVPVRNDRVYTSELLSGTDVSEAKLQDSEGDIVNISKELGEDELGKLSVTVQVEGIGIADSWNNLSYGDSVVLSAATDGNNSFLGWYDSENNLVSEESEYPVIVTENQNYIAKFTDVIVLSESIRIPEKLMMSSGETEYLEAVVLPENATSSGITYESSDEDVASVTEDGIVEAKSSGKATITVRSLADGSVSSQCQVLVDLEDPAPSPVQTASPLSPGQQPQNPEFPPVVAMVSPRTGTTVLPEIPAPSSTVEGYKAPAKVTALKLKAKKKALQASWKKVSGASGYQIWCSTSKKFQKKSVKTTKKTKLTIGKRKAKKAYFVKVRAYTVRDGKKVYGAWSKTMKKKVK